MACELQPDTTHLASGAYTVSVHLLITAAAAGLPSPAAALLLDVRSHTPAEYVAVFATAGRWRAERVAGGHTAVLAERKDAALRAGAWMCVAATVADGRLTVECDGRPVFESLPMHPDTSARPGGPRPHGGLGLAAVRARMDFKALAVRPAAAPAGGPPVLPAPAPAAVPTQERYRGDEGRLVEMVERDVMEARPGVAWDDIAALDDVKALLQEACVLPLLMPELYTGIRQPWKGVLLFGPPGTGKTMLAKAVASQARTTFFNVSASTVVSKFMGESERLVRCLFGMARHYAPSTLFFDEIDGLLSSRGASGEHEASRRLKSEFLSQMDGMSSATGEGRGGVVVLATSNKPWDLDEALRRRLEKRLYVPLPDAVGRAMLIRRLLRDVVLLGDVDVDRLAGRTEGYSGADLQIACREAAMAPLRRYGPQEMLRLRESGALTAEMLGVSMQDLEAALRKTPPSVAAAELPRFLEWHAKFASV